MSEVPDRPPGVRGSTRLAGVIGWPVDHSLSPAIHNAAFSALGMDWVYVPLAVPPPRLAEAIRGLRALGFAGANVTMPHKTEAAEIVGARSDDALVLRAVNTIVVGADEVSGHNTDALGFERFLREDAGFDPAGRSALVFGAGGAARACALALARGGLASLAVAVREPSRADGLRTVLEGFGTTVTVVTVDEAPLMPSNLVINATPLGVHGEALPLPPLGVGVMAVDLLYRPSATPFQTAAREAGCVVFGGLGLLLRQAALSFELWTGQAPPLPVMSAAALGELAEAGPSAEA
ncbi:MAG TPA: shikimate dehydrogenase [Actinomycetota bacterium]|nr:shikimate dehydrogenase [Actinomycetota bacterium]